MIGNAMFFICFILLRGLFIC